ncbi:hypothetical protein [Cetobacterium sp.]|uniref:hypothetical protein n=1 Tax=Cetobacterium sp. TaxID=2071632 RepID=UPI003F66A685
MKEKEAFEDFFKIEDKLPLEIKTLYDQLKNKFYKEVISLPIKNSVGNFYWIEYDNKMYSMKKDNLKLNKIKNLSLIKARDFFLFSKINFQ